MTSSNVSHSLQAAAQIVHLESKKRQEMSLRLKLFMQTELLGEDASHKKEESSIILWLLRITSY